MDTMDDDLRRLLKILGDGWNPKANRADEITETRYLRNRMEDIFTHMYCHFEIDSKADIPDSQVICAR